MKIFGLLLCCSLALTAAIEPALGKVSTGTLEGTVVDAHGHTLAGATVTMQTSDGGHPHATHTDARGHFQFAGFESGQYDLRAHFKGSYSDWAKRVVLHSNKIRSITLCVAAEKP
jgi:hypothetical protein